MNTCKDCRWWVPDAGKPKQGECHVDPPKPGEKAEMALGPLVLGSRPQCSKFKPVKKPEA